MKKYLHLLLLLILPLSLYAKERTPGEALDVAKDFFASHEMVSTRSSASVALVATSDQLFPSKKISTFSNQSAFYVFNKGGDAFVIVSGDDRLEAVLGYSLINEFEAENIPINLKSWLKSYVKEYEYIQQAAPDAFNSRQLTSVTRSYPTSVSPLLGEIMWDQSTPYNDKCPTYNGEHSVTGCVATAMAQVMRYHNYPTKGKGSNSYTTSSLNLSASFDFASTTFDWANMLPQYISGSYTTAQADAVATLMYACGVSVDMDYTTDESGAQPTAAAEALINYFEYNSNIRYLLRDYFSYSEWIDLIKTELSNSRPILYDGQSTEGGHEFVFDGYDENDMVHVNWGWSGANDGYFAISALAPSSLGIGGGNNLGGGFSYDQGMIIGIQTSSTSTTYQSYFLTSEMTPASKSISLGGSTTFSFTDFYNMSTNFTGGELAIIAEINGVQTVLATQTLPTIKAGYGIASFSMSSVTFPSSLSTGTYLVYAATKASGVTNSLSRVRGMMGAATQYYATVSGSSVTLSDYWGDINLAATVDIKHDLYCTLLGDFTMTINNNSNTQEYFGEVGVGFVSNGSLVAVVDPLQIYMSAGETALALTVSDTLSSTITEGTYDIYPVAQWGSTYYTIGDGQSVTVSSDPGVGTLSVSSFAVASSEVEYGDDVTITAQLSVAGTSSIYSGTLAVIVFDSSGTTSQGVFLSNVFFDESPFSFSFSFNPELSVGSYLMALYEYTTTYSQATNGLSFTIVEPTGIKDATIGENANMIMYPTPADEYVNIVSGNDFNRVKVFDLAGAMVIDQAISNTTAYQLNVADLPTGNYLLVITSGNKTYSQKFMKQ